MRAEIDDSKQSPRGSAAVILLVELSRFPSYGGTKRVAVQIASRLDRSRFAPHVLVYRDGPWAEDLRAAGVPVTIFTPPGPHPAQESAAAGPAAGARSWGVRADEAGGRRLSPARRLVSDLLSWQRMYGRDAAVARKLAPHVPAGTKLIHVNHSMVGDTSWFHVARRLRVPFLSHEHGVWRQRTAAWKAVASRAASVVCLTEQRMEEVRVCMNGRVRVDYVPNGILVDSLRPSRGRAEVRAELGIAEGALMIVTAAHYQEWKGQLLALEAAAKLAASGLEFVWVFCGGEVEPGFLDRLRAVAAERSLSERVRLLKERRDVPDLFAAADLAAHTSIHPEPFGLVVLEAMLQGTPVVGAREGAIPELVRDGTDGLLVTPRDAAALAAAIRDLAGSPSRRVAMGEAGRQRVRERFDAGALSRRLEGVYQRAIDEARRGSGRA